MLRFFGLLCLAFLLGGTIGARTPQAAANDSRLTGAFRNPVKDGWIFVHLAGSPTALGYQHGYLLAREIDDAHRAIALSVSHDVKHSWAELRLVAEKSFLPTVPAEYRQELEGIVAGCQARGLQIDLLDLVVMNAYMELPYYYGQAVRPQVHGVAASVGEHCSAFVATGSYTKDRRIVIGHNNWSDYLSGSRWKVIFDIAPTNGHRFIMDGVPGLIHSGDDFGINEAGIMITETTIGNFHGFDQKGIPEFARARKAMQYADSVDQFARLMEEGNNGGYANTWLVGDRKTNEIGRLELGLRYVTLEKTSNGYFVGSNFPINPKLIAEETDFPANDANTPDLVRLRRWNQLMAEYKGRIDVEAGKKFETDHYDVITKEIDPNERTLCGHVDRSSRGMKGWQEPFGPAGSVEAKVADSAMAEKMSFVAGNGKPCGVAFHAAQFLAAHKEYAWQKSELEDLKANRWVVVAASPHPAQ